MRVVVQREIVEDDDLAQAWNHVVEQMERPEVFYTYEWALTVQQAYAERFARLLLLGYEGEVLVAGASLGIDRDTREIVFLAATTGDYCDFVSSAEIREGWVQTVLHELQALKFTRMRFANLPADSRTGAALRKLAGANGYYHYARRGYVCAQVRFQDSQQREELWKNVCSKKMLRRSVRAMERIGRLDLATAREWNEIEPILDQFTTDHVARFLDTGRISNLVRPERQIFLRELAKRLAKKGWITLSQLRLADRPIAWNYGFQYAGSWFWYQPTFHSGFREFSPGYCLLARMLETASQRADILRVDLGLGEEGYKERFANSASETLHVSLDRSYLRHCRTVLRYVGSWTISHSKRLETVIRRMQQRVQVVRNARRETSWPAMVRMIAQRCWKRLLGTDEVVFFKCAKQRPVTSQPAEDAALKPIDFDLLARAALGYHDDEETLNYLLRCAHRVRCQDTQGFALVRDGVPVHFAWVTKFEGFYLAETHSKVTSPEKEAELIFDCWTPHAVRGRGHYSETIGKVAVELRGRARTPWIFSAATNNASLRGIQKAGFEPCFILLRRRVLGIARIDKVPASIAGETARATAASAGQA